MKFKLPRSLVLIPLTLALSACQEPGAREADSGETLPFELTEDRAASIRETADAAFAELESAPTRSETRVGPQPWPKDLPGRWPFPTEATVVADTRHGAGDRLLLVNLPGSPDRAMAAYQSALRERGYDVDRGQLRPPLRALQAQSPEHQAVLTFIAREKATRVEILFLAKAAG